MKAVELARSPRDCCCNIAITLTTAADANGENPVAGHELVVAHKPKAFTCSSVS